MSSYDNKEQRNIIVSTCVLRNFIRKHNSEDEGFEWDEHNVDNPRSNISEEDSSSQVNNENIHEEEMKSIMTR